MIRALKNDYFESPAPRSEIRLRALAAIKAIPNPFKKTFEWIAGPKSQNDLRWFAFENIKGQSYFAQQWPPKVEAA